MAAASRPLPGIRIDVAPPPAVPALPRMDVAVFAGFASTGPLHVPVVVEGPGDFAAVFGADLPLAWDETRGEQVYAHLGPAVRAFFANGGQRCWVVRLGRVAFPGADPARIAESARFEVPGVLSFDGAGLAPAQAQARCEGSWADALRLASALTGRSFAFDSLAPTGSPPGPGLALRTLEPLVAGDLLELGDLQAVVAYASVASVVPDPAGSGSTLVQAELLAAFQRVPVQRLPDQFALPVDNGLAPGRWASVAVGGQPAWLRIDQFEPGATVDLASGPAWQTLPPGLPAALLGLDHARVLGLDLLVGGSQAARASGLGLTPSHPNAWWNQASDADYYAPPPDDGPRTASAQPGVGARFPLCRLAAPVAVAWLPLGVGALFGSETGALVSDRPALQRDGLDPFDASLFLDPELADTPTATLVDLADVIRYQREPTRALLGIHAALAIGGGGAFTEASLLAVPDAVHPGWVGRDKESYLPPHPQLPPTPVQWRTHAGPCPAADATPLAAPDYGVFLDCGTRALAAPVLQAPDSAVAPGSFELRWSDSEPGATYVVVESTLPDLSVTREIYRGTATSFTALETREGVYYCQVFAESGANRSAGSNAVALAVRADAYRLLQPGELDPAFAAQWRSVQVAALRLAAATGELFAVLAMPRHFRTADAVRHAALLRATVGVAESPALSYGALYFPWMQSGIGASAGAAASPVAGPPAPGALRVLPPDGPAAGVMAARAARRGAWIAAANEPMSDVLALDPAVAASDWQALQDAQVNLLRSDPRGFLTLSADTLSLDDSVRPINVRRLLTLLRRLALRRGASYVFEPNGPALRRSVERGFGYLMNDLFLRGAFAGDTADTSFRVVADDTVNTPADADAGRFLVELRVAPSLPMRFVSVRLAQDGPRLAVTEEL